MKYPTKQFAELESAIKILSKYVDVKQVQPNYLHDLIFYNKNESHSHNAFWVNIEGQIARGWQFDKKTCDNLGKELLTDKHNYTRLFPIDNDFKGSPEGCNDTHIETAVKKILNSL